MASESSDSDYNLLVPIDILNKIPDDIKNVALEVVSHRILLKPESKIRGVTGRHITRKILSEVPVPVIQ